MAPANVQSPEDLIESFPNVVVKIAGEPSYDTLAELMLTLKGNAASVPSARGGGAHGYLGIVISPAVYATISPVAWIDPINPGVQPVLPAGGTTAQINVVIRTFEEDQQQWREYCNMQLAFKKQVITAVDAIFLRSIQNRHVGFNNSSIRDMLNFLFQNYGHINPYDLEANDKK
jgi:hypothetical protein